jgi:hypothetical protein
MRVEIEARSRVQDARVAGSEVLRSEWLTCSGLQRKSKIKIRTKLKSKIRSKIRTSLPGLGSYSSLREIIPAIFLAPGP